MEIEAPKRRLSELDGLRGLAIVLVFFKHALLLRMAWIGVDIFFVLSGFLITNILLNQRETSFGEYIKTFYARRVRRIIPPYILALIAGSLLFGLAWTKHWYMYIGLTNYVKMFPGNEFMPFNPFWSLGVEEQFYLFWPVVIFFAREKNLKYVLFGLLLAAPLFRVLLIPLDSPNSWNNGHWLVYRATITRMDTLAAGALFCLLWRNPKYKERIQKHGYLGLFFFFAIIPLMIFLSRFGGFSTKDGTVRGNLFTFEIALIGASGIFLWALGGRFAGIFRLAPLRYMGKISYSFYLIHMSVILYTEKYIHNETTKTLVAFAAALTYSTLSWFLMEKHLLSHKPSSGKAVEARVPSAQAT